MVDTAEQYSYFREILEKEFSGERLKGLNKMYDDLEDVLLTAPASSYKHFHNCFDGGYLDHIIRVYEYGIKVYELYESLGFTMDDFTREELAFSAIHHDLGKLGNGEQPHYVPEHNDWYKDKQNKYYNTNPEIDYMDFADRTFWLLNQYGVKYTVNEFLGIRLADGLYEEYNKKYYVKYNESDKIKTSLPYIIHQADTMAFKFEFDNYLNNKSTQPTKTHNTNKPKKTRNFSDKVSSKDLSNMFDNLFDK